ncbi:peptide-methionine (S)-S-oxide reductase [Flavobacterium sp. UMI-01]|uniref:peptide-methionine (S)-S-oxide reductase n=1 Tax=Flavobacterium sp. UMI-01 TaxID=1441053 RepID=UPI001C7D5435|nr:peptide-methionine (S)-S-oxide reductase [Flavobacterium sp. UMI-01]GIZ09001.1 peptide methionine sulfoxide reductase MsrA [Flavobacterium sp. UMI-01]
MTEKIGLGGGCHWCTEAVFQSLIGVTHVDQGWMASDKDNIDFSEAIIVHYNRGIIPLEILIQIHLETHQSSINHAMRRKYRSAIYYFDKKQMARIREIVRTLRKTSENPIITQVLPFVEFKVSREVIQNYYYKNPEKPFCKNYIKPKLKILLERYSKYISNSKLKNL